MRQTQNRRLPKYRIECDIWHRMCGMVLISYSEWVYLLYYFPVCCTMNFGISRHFWRFIDSVLYNIFPAPNQSFDIHAYTYFSLENLSKSVSVFISKMQLQIIFGCDQPLNIFKHIPVVSVALGKLICVIYIFRKGKGDGVGFVFGNVFINRCYGMNVYQREPYVRSIY